MADDWSAFTAAPTAAPVAPAPTAPADDGWAAFSAPPAAPAAQKYDEYNAQGQWIGTSEEGYQGANSKPQGSPGPASSDAASPGKSGYVANLAAGGNAAVASALGAPVDLATGGINLATRGINAVTGAHIPEITDPVGGSGTFKRAMGVIRANPDDVKSDSIWQEIARGVGGGIVSAAIPAGATAAAVSGGMMAAPAAARTLAVLGDATPQNALLGAASGGAGEAAAAQVPDEYKPVAGLAGGVLGVGVPLAGIAGLRGAARAAKDYIAPATGRANPLLDTAGGVIADANGTPINMLSGGQLAATPNQVQIAGRRLQTTASDPAAVRTALATQGPPALNDQPTTAQLTRDPGLLAAERGISRTAPNAQAPFIARAPAQNDARVGAVRGVAEGGDPAALPAALQAQAADADAAAAARVAGVQVQTASDVTATDAAGQAQVAEAQQAVEHARTAREAESEAKLAALHETTGQTQARLEAESQARVDELQKAAEQARGGLGGDLPPGSEGQVGAALRAPIDAANQAAKARESALWNQIDPDGTLAVSMAPIKSGAQDILKEMSPNAAPLAGNEAGIFQTASALPNVQSFRDLGALRSRLTDAIRHERGPAGDPQAVRRMSMLLGHVQDAMEIGAQRADDLAAASGAVAPDQTFKSQLLTDRQAWYAEQADAARSTARASDAGSGGRNVASGPRVISPMAGSKGPQGGGSGNHAGDPGLQGQPPLAPNFDEEAKARYAAARQATSERAATFKNPPGVKEALQGGPNSGTFRLPDVSVPATFIRVGPEGATRVQSYLAAGGSPEALSDAAAFSLRRDASRADGTLDPAKVATWSQQRGSFLSALPDSAAKFGDAAAAQRALDDATKAEAQALKASESANVRMLKDASSNEARALKDRADEDLKALKATTSAAAQSLKDAVKAAQATVDEAVAARADQAKAVQRSVVGKFLGTADPVTRVASILRSPTAVADMRELAARVANDPEAKAGLQRAVAEHILRDLKGNNAGVGGENFLKGDQLQTFLRTREPALREVLTPGQMQSLRNVAESLERSNLSVSGSKMAGGSDSLQIASAGSSASPSTFLGQFMRKTGSAITTGGGTLLGSLLGGPVGAGIGFASGLGVAAAQAGREAGMRTIDDLVANAMLNPQLAAVLLAKVTPNNRSSLSGALLSQLRRMSLVSSAVGQQDQGNARRNTLLQ